MRAHLRRPARYVSRLHAVHVQGCSAWGEGPTARPRGHFGFVNAQTFGFNAWPVLSWYGRKKKGIGRTRLLSLSGVY